MRNAMRCGLPTDALAPAAPAEPLELRQGDSSYLGSLSLSNITSLYVRWDEPASDVPITNYVLEVNGSALDVGERTSYVITPVWPGSNASVRVQARSAAGASRFTDPIELRAAEPAPPEVRPKPHRARTA